MKVNVLDAPMGFGKTCGLINYMNTHPERRYMFVTPFLSEADRVIDNCPALDFKTPISMKLRGQTKRLSKQVDLLELLNHGENIVTTHALFMRFSPEIVEAIRAQSYVLVMDEVVDVVSQCDLHPKDARLVQEHYTFVNEDGHLQWKQTSRVPYNGLFSDIKILADSGSLWRYNDFTIMSVLPISLFTAFEEVFLMTYMFADSIQRCYFDLFHIEYQSIYVTGDSPQSYTLTTEPQQYKMPGLRKLIHICDDKKLNAIGRMVDRKKPLSRAWYDNKEHAKALKKMGNNIVAYFRSRCKAECTSVLWTAFKARSSPSSSNQGKPVIHPNGYAKGFIPCTARATNAYKDRMYLAYPLDRYLIPAIKLFFSAHNIPLDQNRWALSEMLQWIWRSAIRDGKEIWIYIPSERMRGLLKDWIKEVDTAA